MISYVGCTAFPKLPKNKNTFTVKRNKIRENLTYAGATANNSQQRAPRNSDILAQTEARRNSDYRYNPENSSRATENNHSDNFYQAIELIANLGENFNKLPGLIKHLPNIKAAKGAENKKYALIEALMDEENEIGITLETP
ncbi:hypothetical protein NPIL_421241 [Nephila pilipes]|uniref:Uncharacterized protein n=1 Tax=Nephila pilipes TaxID=299642 RepID=A0A8X6T330_NEPPI|nr:hypothetical protein NPIL_421241 [Nephila pilipes]